MVILYTGLIGLQCLNQLFMMVIFPFYNGKIQHLQNSMIGRAKSAMEGYGDSYYEAVKELEFRFGKASLILKVTLHRLKQLAYKMTSLKKLGTCLMLC